MFCPACGTSSATDDLFCRSCGKALPPSAPTAGADSPAAADWSTFPPPPPPAASVDPQEFSPSDVATAQAFPPAMPPPPPFGAPPLYPTYPYPAYPPPGGPFQAASPAGGRLTSFGAPLARWWQRVGSLLLDYLIVVVPLAIVNAIMNSAFGTVHTVKLLNGTFETQRSIQGPAHALILIGTAAIMGVYFSILNGTGNGQTVGNRTPGIAVRDATTGEVIGFKRGLLRWFIRFVLYLALILPGLLNDLFPLWDSRSQTIADKAARSVVIRLK
jgi:uncharacterized RDD family membrane protein YckC